MPGIQPPSPVKLSFETKSYDEASMNFWQSLFWKEVPDITKE